MSFDELLEIINNMSRTEELIGALKDELHEVVEALEKELDLPFEKSVRASKEMCEEIRDVDMDVLAFSYKVQTMHDIVNRLVRTLYESKS